MRLNHILGKLHRRNWALKLGVPKTILLLLIKTKTQKGPILGLFSPNLAPYWPHFAPYWSNNNNKKSIIIIIIIIKNLHNFTLKTVVKVLNFSICGRSFRLINFHIFEHFGCMDHKLFMNNFVINLYFSYPLVKEDKNLNWH